MLTILFYRQKTKKPINLMLSVLNGWCNDNKMVVNSDKSKIVHFRGPSVPRTTTIFRCGDLVLDIQDSYHYLGVLLTEHLDLNAMAKCAAKSASRSLGFLI